MKMNWASQTNSRPNGFGRKALRVVQVVLVLGLVLGFATQTMIPAFAQVPAPTVDPKLGEGSITLPADIMKDYSIAAAKSITFTGASGAFLVVAYEPKTFSMENPLPSFMVIYQTTDSGFDPLYRYLPEAPADLGYPMPLSFENMWPITTWTDGNPETVNLVTAWGETGADYWGSQPIMLGYADGTFKAVPLYQGKLADDQQIKGFQWTTADFEVKNAFDPANTVTTILTQGVTVDGSKVSLSFWADNECKACEHKIVNIEIDLQK